MPIVLIVAFLASLAAAAAIVSTALKDLSEGLAALPRDHGHAPPAPPAQPPIAAPEPPPTAIAGETYAEFFARTGYLLKGPDDHEISGLHVFDGHSWVPATA